MDRKVDENNKEYIPLSGFFSLNIVYDIHPRNCISLILLLCSSIHCRNSQQVFIDSIVRGHLGVPRVELLQAVLLWALSTYLSVHVHSYFFGIFLGVGLLDYKVSIPSTEVENAELPFPKNFPSHGIIYAPTVNL